MQHVTTSRHLSLLDMRSHSWIPLQNRLAEILGEWNAVVCFLANYTHHIHIHAHVLFACVVTIRVDHPPPCKLSLDYAVDVAGFDAA
jgi:hypothetical protein